MDTRTDLVEAHSNTYNNTSTCKINYSIDNFCNALPVIQCNEDFILVFVNDSLADLLNLSKEYVIGRSIFDTILSETIPIQNSNFISSFDNGTETPCELNFELKGAKYHCLSYNFRSNDDNGSIYHTSILLNLGHVSEEIKSSMFDRKTEAIAELNLDGDIIYANPELFALFEISQSERISNYKAKEFIDVSNYLENPALNYDEIVRKEGTITLKLLTAKQKLFLTDIKIEPLYDSNNQYYGTRLHFPSKAIHSPCQEIHGLSPIDILENLPDFTLLLDVNGIIKYISPNFKTILGIGFDENRNLNPFEYVHPDDQQKIYNLFINLSLIPGSTATGKYRYRLNNNEYVWLEAVATNHLNNPKVRGILVSIRDITETLLIDEFHNKQSDNLRIVAQYANVLMLILDLEGKIILSEGKAFSQFDLEPSQIIGSNINDFIHLDDKAKIDFQNALYGEEVRTVFTIQDNTFEGIFSPYYDSSNNQIGVVLISTDITERSILDREKEELIDALQSSRETIIEESQKLWELNKKLAESEGNLIKSNSEKDKFFSIISHDLRSPLSGINGMLESLVAYFDSYSPTEIKETVTSLLDSSKNLYKLLDNLLIWSRIQRGVMVNNPDFLPAKVIINNVFDLLNYTASQKGIQLITKVEEDLTIFADFNMINTSLRNLVSNSIKFTPEGGSITISAKSINTSFAQFNVQDTGVGMSTEDLNKLFKLDVNHTTAGTNNEQGTGLGLILCKEMVNQNKGNIWVESELGIGSTFSFTVPIDAITNAEDEENLKTSDNTTNDENDINNSKYYQICLTDKEYHPSQELLEVLPEIIPELEDQFLPLRNNLLNTIVVNDVIDFAVKLRKFGDACKLQCVIDYSIALYDKCNVMDLDQIHNLLIGFDMIISRLKGFIGIYE